MSYGGSYDGDGGQGQGANQLIRWIIGLVIALIGVGMYMTRTQVNQVTGEKQHVGDMTIDQEKALGLQAAPEMAEKMGGYLDPRDDERAMTVNDVGQRIVERSDASRSPYVGNFHFHLLSDSKTVNAFALPGGQVFITEALFGKLRNEAELAGVLGHEIGHVIERHSAQQMAKGQLGQMLTVAVGVGASGQDDGGRKAQMASLLASQMFTLRNSRGDETEADEVGLKYMAEAGYDPQQMLEVMKILKEASGGGGQPEFLQTHPLPETRLEDIKEQIKKNYPDGVPTELTKGRALNTSSR